MKAAEKTGADLVVRLGPYAAVAVLALLYAFSVLDFPWPGDSAELVTAAATLGVAHPTGYPLYVLLGHAAVSVFSFVEPAVVMNWLSAVFMIAAMVLLVGVLRRIQVASPVIAAAVLVVGTTPTLWENASFAEVYTLHVLLSVLLLDAVVRGEGEDRWWRLALPFFIAGLAMANHMTSVLYFPGLLVWLLLQLRGSSKRKAAVELASAALAAAVGASCMGGLMLFDRPDALNYLEQYAREFPHAEFDDPLQRFLWISAGGQYGAGAENLRGLLAPGMLTQSARYLVEILNHAPPLVLGGLLGLFLAAFDPKRFRVPAAAMRFVAITVAVLALYLVAYSRSFSEHAFFAVGYVYLGIGLAIAIQRGLQARRMRGLVIVALVLASAFSVVTHRGLFARGDGEMYLQGDEAFLASIEPDAVVFSTWGNSSLFWYSQWVRGVNPGVLVLNARPDSWPRLMYEYAGRPIYVENVPYHLNSALFVPHHHFYRLRGSGG